MVGDIFQPTHLLFVLVVALLVLGPKRLPEVGRTLGSGIRDFRQALSGDTPDPPQRHQSEQVTTTTADPATEPHAAAATDVNWPEPAIGPISYDEPVEAASAEPATAVVTDPEPAVVAETEPATETAPSVSGLDALYFDEPAGETIPTAAGSDSTESHDDQIS